MDAPAHGRRVRRDAAGNRQAIASITPFLKQFNAWHARSALLQAQLMAGRSDPAALHEELNKLSQEVASGYRAFRTSVAEAPPHGRIDDVDNTFQRLLQSLRATTSG